MAENKDDFLTAVSYNCRGINSSSHDIQELCKINQIVFLQETWLSKQQLNKLSTISNYHYSFGISGLNYEDGFKLGRPYGGEAILRNQSLRASIIHKFDKSFIGLKLELDKSSLFLINIYMPCSTYHNIDEYVEKLSKLASFCKELNNFNICLLDFNAGLENSFGKIYSQFCQDNSFIMSDNMILPTNSFTFLSNAHGSTSWIDHCASTSSAYEAIESIKILQEFIISDHRPLQVTFICNKLARVEYEDVNTPHSKSINWKKLTQQQKRNTHKLVSITSVKYLYLML